MRRLPLAFSVLALCAWPAAGRAQQTTTYAHMGDPAFAVHDVQPLEKLPSIKGAPFTAEAITEFTQVLGDGNRIERTFTTSLARDGQGRTRREQEIALVGPLAQLNATAPKIVTISDPEAGVNYTLNTVDKTAVKSPAFYVGLGKVQNIRTGPDSGVVVNVEPGAPAATVEWVGADAAKFSLTSAIEGQLIVGASPVDTLIAAPKVDVQPLGTTSVEGVIAEGTRTTMTIPAGAIGNIAPIEVVTERWFSKELGVAVKITRRDPRTGDSIYRLANIVRAEPPPDLFQVPPDYDLREPRGGKVMYVPGSGTHRVRE